MPIFLKVNHQLESRVQEICQSGSEGGARPTFVPTPIANPKSRPVGYCMIRAGMRTDSTWRPFPREIPLGLAAPDHTVPYGTVLSRDTFPGTSCLAWSLDISAKRRQAIAKEEFKKSMRLSVRLSNLVE